MSKKYVKFQSGP